MGCNCNKRKKIYKRDEVLAERAARIASANPQPVPVRTDAAATRSPSWSPERGPRSHPSADDVAS